MGRHPSVRLVRPYRPKDGALMTTAEAAPAGTTCQAVRGTTCEGVRGQQVLHPIRRGVSGVLGDRPAVLAWQVRQQPLDKRPARRRGSTRGNRPATRPSSSSSPACQRARSPSTLWPAATVDDPVLCAQPKIRRWPPYGAHQAALTSQATIYGWSTDVERCVNGAVCLVDGAISARVR